MGQMHCLRFHQDEEDRKDERGGYSSIEEIINGDNLQPKSEGLDFAKSEISSQHKTSCLSTNHYIDSGQAMTEQQRHQIVKFRGIGRLKSTFQNNVSSIVHPPSMEDQRIQRNKKELDAQLKVNSDLYRRIGILNRQLKTKEEELCCTKDRLSLKETEELQKSKSKDCSIAHWKEKQNELVKVVKELRAKEEALSEDVLIRERIIYELFPLTKCEGRRVLRMFGFQLDHEKGVLSPCKERETSSYSSSSSGVFVGEEKSDNVPKPENDLKHHRETKSTNL